MVTNVLYEDLVNIIIRIITMNTSIKSVNVKYFIVEIFYMKTTIGLSILVYYNVSLYLRGECGKNKLQKQLYMLNSNRNTGNVAQLF